MKNRFRFSCLLVFAVVGSWTGAGAPIVAEDFDLADLQEKIYSAVSQVLPAVVSVSDQGRTFSAVIVTRQGHIITAGHAVRPNGNYTVTLADGRKVKARGLGANKRVDCAMLKISNRGEWPFAEMGQSSVLVRNQPCISIGHPGKFDAQRGPVIRFGRIIDPVTDNEGMILSTAKMEPGDSGGPLIDFEGKVIGIHSNIRRSTNENYDVPIDSFRINWDELNQARRLEIVGLPNLPKLGFRGDEDRDSGGIIVLRVEKNGIAAQAGLQKDDIVIELQGQKVSSLDQVKSRMIQLRSRSVREITVKVTRDGRQQTLKFGFPVDYPIPAFYRELADLPGQFKSLEAILDDDVFVLQSRIKQKLKTVRATRIRRTERGNLLSKSSRVGEHPMIQLGKGKWVAAQVVGRDEENDLVLLQAALPGTGGVDLEKMPEDMPEQPGKLLLTPDPQGNGDISVWGSRYFNVPRTRATVKNLGVVLGYRAGEITFERVRPGGARNAGIHPGDHLVRLDGNAMNTQRDVTQFLFKQNPTSTISAVVRRGRREMEKTITLGTSTRERGHVADRLIGGKSVRRDGFTLAISHDGDIKPEDCGGPVFDMHGTFLGINMARFSRTRCYLIPPSVLRQFVDDFGS